MHFKSIIRGENGGSQGSLRKRVNQALLEMYNTGALEQLKDKYKTNLRFQIILVVSDYRWWEKEEEDSCTASTRTGQLGSHQLSLTLTIILQPP